MLISKLLLLIANIIAVLVGWLPAVTALPTVGGYDIDTALINGVSFTYDFANVVWPVADVLAGALFIWTFHSLMLFLRFLLGHRAPAAYH